jgi:uncharacterized protein (TIGR00369 family)
MPFDPAAEGWKIFDSTGIAGTIGPFWSRREGDGWRYGLLADARHANHLGLVHGGVLMTFVDNIMGMTAWQAVAREPVVTLQLDTQFISAAKLGEFLQGSAHVVRATRSVVFIQGVIRSGDRDVVAATGIWKRLAPRADPATPPPTRGGIDPADPSR